jgi:hypothetical protein
MQDPMFVTDEGNQARCELDTHADTCVAGVNFLIQSFDGQTCDVMPYSDDYQAIRDVPVVTAATAWTNTNTGETFILYFPQMLWYGKKMKASLINPNQLRHYGLKVCDDVTDKERSFGIQLDEDLIIPFKMDGTVVYFDTRVPSELEMDNCRIYAMTDDAPWDPSNVKIGKIKQISREAMCMSEIRKIACTNQTNWYDLERSIIQSVSGAYDGATIMRRMVKAVNIATGSRKYERDGTYVNKYLNVITHGVSFIGSKD